MNQKIIWLVAALMFVSCTFNAGNKNTVDLYLSMTTSPTTTILTPNVSEATLTVQPRATSIPSKTPFPTLTPLPTFTSAETERFLLGLYNNGVCLLPCWGGLIPGETTWSELEQKLDATNIELTTHNINQGGVIYIEIPRLGIASSLGLYRTNDDLQMIKPKINTKDYDFQTLLTKYGPPDEILVHAFNTTPEPEEYLPFNLLAYYRKGILIEYEYKIIKREADLVVCPAIHRAENPILWVGQPDKYESWIAFAKETGEMADAEKTTLLPLSTATNYTIETLYDDMTSQKKDILCIRTPRTLWP